MTIRVSLGNVGSGKTVCEVREMMLNRMRRTTYSNILMKKPKLTPHVKPLTMDLIVKKTVIGSKKEKKSGTETLLYDFKLNIDFWRQKKEAVNIVLDEAHSIINSRKAMSKVNIVMSDFLALIRRVLGGTDSGHGELVLITQLPYRLDNIARDMTNEIRYHVCSYTKQCRLCGVSWVETSESPEHHHLCLSCGRPELFREHFKIHVWHFVDFDSYFAWKDLGERTFYKAYVINDIETYFPLYDTLQWENMFSELY